MIYLNCRDIETEKDSYIQIELDVRYDDSSMKNKIVEKGFEDKILKAIKRNKKTIFSINRTDNDVDSSGTI